MSVGVGSTSRGRGLGTALLLVAFAVTALLAEPAAAAKISGTVSSASAPVSRAPMTLLAGGEGRAAPRVLARAWSDARGRFSFSYRKPRGSEGVVYVTSGVPGTNRRRAVRLAAVLDPDRATRRVRLNERTTVAAATAEAAFVRGWKIGGPSPGPRNAAMMAANLADPASGRIARALKRPPNGRGTPTMATFNSLANAIVPCVRRERPCARLFAAMRARGERRPTSTLQALADVAANPGSKVARIFRLSRRGPAPYSPTLPADDKPGNWGLFLRFVGDGKSLDGPGNIAFDADGNAWVANNYQYSRDPETAVCGGEIVPVFRPDGMYADFSPIAEGGISGSGYGITFDPQGQVWVGNFGFAAPPPGCPTESQPPHNTVSKYETDGTALSGPEGIDAGVLSWPQGTVSNERGDIWIANCGPYGAPLDDSLPHDSLTIYPEGDPSRARSIRDPNLNKPFDIVFNHAGKAFVSSTLNDAIAMYEPDGTPTASSPLRGGGLNNPMGVAADSGGNVWVANSAVIDLPCPGDTIDLADRGGSVTLIGSDGEVLSPDGSGDDPGGFTGGGARVPWGIAVDGDDNVWVSNFAGRRVSEFCGLEPRNCPPGRETGDPISPAAGYGFSGLQRNTAVEIDPAGNVWITNNWKLAPIQTNPGGYHVVVMVGAASPVKTPLIGPTRPLR